MQAGVIPVNITDISDDGIHAYFYTITYDPTIIEVTGASTTGTISASASPIVNNDTPGILTIAWADAFSMTGAGVLTNVNVNFISTGTSALTFSFHSFNEGFPTGQTVNGSVVVLTENAGSTFIESGGMLVMEAENAGGIIAKNAQAWEGNTATSGYSGASYLEALPDNGTVIKKNALDQAPELVFTADFSTTGSYAIWVRLTGPTRGLSVHVGKDGVLHDAQSVIEGSTDGWTWSRLMNSGNIEPLEITSTGPHNINIWMREDGVQVDKVLLTTDLAFTPSGVGPSESPRFGPERSGLVLNQLTAPSTDASRPRSFTLENNYPNPFNPTTTITFELPEATPVNLIVYDATGRQIATLIDSELAAGRYEAHWNAQTDTGAHVASGIYLYRLRAGSFEAVKQMVLMK